MRDTRDWDRIQRVRDKAIDCFYECPNSWAHKYWYGVWEALIKDRYDWIPPKKKE